MNQPFYLNLRNLISGVDTKVPLLDGSSITAVNFDNAASTPPFVSVIKAIDDFSQWYSSVHRGTGYKSKISTEVYENAREAVRNFIGSDKEQDTVIFTKNTTESLNMLSVVLQRSGDERNIILTTGMEHAANDLPWRFGFHTEYVETDASGRLDLNDMEQKLKKFQGKVLLVAVTGASNVTGYMNPLDTIAAMAHRYGADMLLDAAQMAPHAAIDMQNHQSESHIDYLAFSAHKMYAPFGSGVLVGPKKTFEKGIPFCTGGGAIKLVTRKRVQWEAPPDKNEAGTPNVMGAVALAEAIKTLSSIGMHTVYNTEKQLFDYAYTHIVHIPGIQAYCQPKANEKRIGVLPLNISGMHHSMVARILSYEAGIAVRDGFFCTHPYCEKLLGLSEEDMNIYFENPEMPKPGMVRVSFGLYNETSEIDRLVYALKTITSNKDYYIQKYSNPGMKNACRGGV